MSEPLTRERQVFDPDSICDALELNLPEALRALADAIEAKDIDGQVASVKANALSQHWRDTRLHLFVPLDIAAQANRLKGNWCRSIRRRHSNSHRGGTLSCQNACCTGR